VSGEMIENVFVALLIAAAVMWLVILGQTAMSDAMMENVFYVLMIAAAVLWLYMAGTAIWDVIKDRR
jgi:hypothetical protein